MSPFERDRSHSAHLYKTILQIWAGTKDCKLVEWEDCILETKKVEFHYIQPDCSGKKPVPLHDIHSRPKISQTSTLKCYVKKTSPCVQGISLIT